MPERPEPTAGRPPLPPLVLALAPGPSPRVLVAERSPDGAVAAGLDRWPPAPAPGALLLVWPRRFPWSGKAAAFADAVREEGGAVLPLAAVLAKLGVNPGRGTGGLVRALAPGLQDIEDPGALGTALAAGLADLLGGEGAGASPAGPVPRPDLLLRLQDLPPGPGVYTFLAADRRPLYVGKARSLRNRVPQHFAPGSPEPEKGRILARDAAGLEWEAAGSELEALLVEQLKIAGEAPVLNTQTRVHARPRGAWREACLALALPSAREGCVEVCLVAGDGRFHWERGVRRGRGLPRKLWARVRGFLEGDPAGAAPGEPGRTLTPQEAAGMAEIALSWLARRGDEVSRIDLRRESGGRALMGRLRRLLAEDPRDRVEVR